MSDMPIMSLAEALPYEQRRVRQILLHRREIGAAGEVGTQLISQLLDATEKAVSSGNDAEMLIAYHGLRAIKA